MIFTSSFNMAVLTWLGYIFFFGYTHCFDNLSRGAIVTQSSTFKDRNASFANDGKVWTDYGSCAHTDVNHTKAWFQVDLQRTYSLKSVKIYYRNQGDWKPYRFRQFYLDVSEFPAKDRITTQRTRCYTDYTTAQDVPEYVIDIPCKKTGRYVIVETTYDAPEDGDTIGAILEICEIEVNGCEVGTYGIRCTQCKGCQTCDIISGSCQCNANCKNNICNSSGFCTEGCVEKYWGPTCNSQCPVNCKEPACYDSTGLCVTCISGFWGDSCTLQCSSFCYERVCDKTNGNCIQGCLTGRYGDTCDKNCSYGCVGVSCNKESGICKSGCKQNWAGNKCDRCDAAYHGSDCSFECNTNCVNSTCDDAYGSCTFGCKTQLYGNLCNRDCSSCPTGCDRITGKCVGTCLVGNYGIFCNETCNQGCRSGCDQHNGICHSCIDGFFGDRCNAICSTCHAGCNKITGECSGNCPVGYFGKICTEPCNLVCKNGCHRDTGICISCVVEHYGHLCNESCSPGCSSGCNRKNGSCTCKSGWQGETCNEPEKLSGSAEFPATEVGAGLGALLLVVAIIVVIWLIRTKRNNSSKSASSVLFHKSASDPDDSKRYTNVSNVSVAIEDPDEEPQIEKPEECVYYKNLSVAKDIPVSDLLTIITTKQAKENEGFLREFKSLPYGERFPCEVAKSAENIPKNRFKTTFPYDHSRVVLESSKEFNSDYINANHIENMDGKREFIASQGPRANTMVDHWRMIWQEHVNYIIMLTNLIEGQKIKCHQYWPEVGKEMDVEPFSLTLLEEKVYAYFVVRKMAVRKKKVTGSRTVVQFHYTRWPDHGTPDPLNLVDFLRQFRHKIKPSHHPILVHCSAGIGRTGTFIALDVLSRYGHVKGKINVIEYVKALRKDRMTMIQNVDQYVFLYHALYEFFRRSGHFVRKDDFLSEFANLHKAETKKQLSDEFNELTSLKTKYDAKDYKSGKKHQKLNASKSVLPVEKYLVYLTSHIAGRETYYNAVNVSSFTKAEELISAQFPVAGAAIDLVRLLIDEDCSFLVCLNPMSEVKELKDWVNDKIKTIKLEPYEITKHAQTGLSPDIRKTSLKIKGKEDDILDVEILECLSWSSSQTVPADKSILIDFIKQFCLDRRSHPDGRVAVLSKDGASGCGVFCAVYNAVQQIQQDHEVDLFTIVRQLQVRRPEMISTVEEYELCYDAVHQYLASDSVYANT